MTEDQERRQTEKIRAAGYSPAFPLFIPGSHYGTGSEAHNGMTLRDYFAGQCLRDTFAALACNGIMNLNSYRINQCAQMSYAAADAMLAARDAAQ